MALFRKLHLKITATSTRGQYLPETNEFISVISVTDTFTLIIENLRNRGNRECNQGTLNNAIGSIYRKLDPGIRQQSIYSTIYKQWTLKVWRFIFDDMSRCDGILHEQDEPIHEYTL